jgi:DNA-binding transcriptional LysR family regulator
LCNEEADIGLTGGDVFDPMLEVLHTGVDRLVAVCPRAHPLAKKRRIGSSDLARTPLVLTAPGTSVRAVVDAALGELREPFEVACEPTYMMTAVAMVRAGLGVTILPETAREVRAEPGLVVKAIDDPAFVRSIAIIKKRGRTLPAITDRFVGLMRQGVATQ